MQRRAPNGLRGGALNTLFSATLLALTACNSTVTPRNVLDKEYTVWGAFDPTTDLQAIRIVPILESPELRTDEPLDVTVTSTNLDTGDSIVWRDSLVAYGSTSARIYIADFQPAFGSHHQLDIVPASGKPLRVYVPVPPSNDPVISSVLDYAGSIFTIAWPGASQLNAVQLTYRVQDFDCEIDEYTYDFPGISEVSEAEARLVLDLHFTADKLRGEFPDGSPDPDGPLRLPLDGLRIEAEVASSTWQMDPMLAADPEALRKADVFTNVENGFGFVGSAYPDTIRWTPTEEELSLDTTFFPLKPIDADSSNCGPIIPRPRPMAPEGT